MILIVLKRIEFFKIVTDKRKSENEIITSGGSKGGARDARPSGSKFFQFHASFWENLTKSYVGAPLGSWRSLLGEILDSPLITLLMDPRGVPEARIPYLSWFHICSILSSFGLKWPK